MPPKDKASKKSVEKEKQRIVEDKTFGLKNKNKSKKVEKYIKSVQSQVANKGFDKKAEAAAQAKKEEKARQEQAKKDMEMLFKPVVQQPKAPLGVDPKSIVCEYFKVGQCTKGHKCKYSHDLKVEMKSAKIDIYTDRRAAEDTMDSWDDAKLNQVVADKRTEANKNLKTTIICKYFIDAIEQQKYGWFWECPNGGAACMYVHALPPGYVLKKKKGEEDEEEDEPTPLEEIIEQQRKQLKTLTPVTLETFLAWKAEKKRKKEEARKAAEEKRLADIKAGKTAMSGREMFVFNPDVFVDDDEAADDDTYKADEDYQAPDESYKNNENDDEEGTTVDNLNVQVNESLFLNGDIDDIPDDEEGEGDE
eukprot:Phypoly_transcript_10070.p1 GENE.Phypoly_transcript_10070~~Phypoly_transcript_10070.p1  ORF type:complete len:363 (+),score=111.53 Phypoly_transcript_10070:49-1137(+)